MEIREAPENRLACRLIQEVGCWGRAGTPRGFDDSGGPGESLIDSEDSNRGSDERGHHQSEKEQSRKGTCPKVDYGAQEREGDVAGANGKERVASLVVPILQSSELLGEVLKFPEGMLGLSNGLEEVSLSL